MTMFRFVMFLVYSSSIFDIVMIGNEFMHEFAKRLIQYLSRLSGGHYRGMVLRYCLPANALYMPGHVVDRGCDTPVDSFVVHSPYVERVELDYEGRLALFLFFLNNIPDA